MPACSLDFMTKFIPPTVSVILPTFNRKKYVVAAVQSVLAQTYKDFELIVLDDGSTDGTKEALEAFGTCIRYVYQANAGRSNARNHALRLARGRYIAFLDSDDLFLPHKLGVQVQFLDDHQRYGMVYTSAKCISEDGSPLPHAFTASASGRIYQQIAFFVPVTVALPTVMIRREVLMQVGGFDEVMERFEDTDLWRRVSKQVEIGALEDDTCLIRTHPDNALDAQDIDRLLAALEYYVSKLRREDKDLGSRSFRKGTGALYFYYGSALVRRSRWFWQGMRLLERSILLLNIRVLPLVVLRVLKYLKRFLKP